MDTFLKIAAGILVAAILSLILSKQTKDFSVILILAVCCMTAAVAMQYLESIIEMIESLVNMAGLDSGMIKILLKSVGIAILSEIVSLVCNDSGNTTLAKVIQIFAAVMILYLSIPLFTKLVELVEVVLTSSRG